MFNFVKGPSIWPLCYSIMNLPPSLRNKVHIGLHIASFCRGIDASQQTLAKELLSLWENPIRVEGVPYYVVVAQLLTDGPGRTKYCKCRATTSFDGCPICDVDARQWGGRRVYDSMRRYTKPSDWRRKKWTQKHVIKDADNSCNDIRVEFPFAEQRPFPQNRYVSITDYSPTITEYCMFSDYYRVFTDNDRVCCNI